MAVGARKTTRGSKPAKAAPKTAASRPTPPPRPARKVGPKTLERLDVRVVSFLKAIGEIDEVRQALMRRGYNDAVHQQGWSLLETVLGRSSFAPPPVAEPEPAPTATPAAEGLTPIEAAAQVEAWSAPNFAVADAALQNRHPAVHAYVFAKKLKAAKGAKGLLAAQTFLTRLNSLGGPDRAAHLADDKAALTVLDTRGITVAERTRIRGLIDLVHKGNAASTATPKPVANPASMAAKLALYVWHTEWSKIARSEVTRGDYLIRLGLATRRPTKRAKAAKAAAKTPAAVATARDPT